MKLESLGFGLRIMMYHSIADNPNDPHAVHPDHFSAQIAFIAARYQVVDLLTAVTELRQWRHLVNTVALTFDDAYADFLENAAPVLKRYCLPATLFVPTGLLGRTAEWDSYDKSKPLMDLRALLEVQRLGFQIGSHTVTHPRLTDCNDKVLHFELRESREYLRLHVPDSFVPILSYPGGYFGPREIRAARQAGFVAGLGTASRLANFPWSNPFRLRRARWIA
ncbi:MAG: polysaccharide deacetylase family protein [Chloroflexi bacterium]|nr:polysaccharide deacetylase family protein [Chloroflexota bacterium]